ncbi:hypothetical protein [Nonomuraea cavernae]
MKQEARSATVGIPVLQSREDVKNCAFTHVGVGHATNRPHWTQVFATH